MGANSVNRVVELNTRIVKLRNQLDKNKARIVTLTEALTDLVRECEEYGEYARTNKLKRARRILNSE
jgi:hypothetical protein